MDRGLAMVIGMTIAYGASFLGMAFAYVGWKKRHREREGGEEAGGEPGGVREQEEGDRSGETRP